MELFAKIVNSFQPKLLSEKAHRRFLTGFWAFFNAVSNNVQSRWLIKYFQFNFKHFVKFCVVLSNIVFIWAWLCSGSLQRWYSRSRCVFVLYFWGIFSRKLNQSNKWSNYWLLRVSFSHNLLEREDWQILEIAQNCLLHETWES